MEELINIEEDKTVLKTNVEKWESKEARFRRSRPNIGDGEGDGAFYGKNEKDLVIYNQSP